MEIDLITSKLLSGKISRRELLIVGLSMLIVKASPGCIQKPIEETNPLFVPERLETFLSKEENQDRILNASQSFSRVFVDQIPPFPRISIFETSMDFQERFRIKTINFSIDEEDELMVSLEWVKNQPLGEDFQKSRTPWPAFILGSNQKSEKVLKPTKAYQTFEGETTTPHRYLALMFSISVNQGLTDREWILLVNKGLLSDYSTSIILPLRFRLNPSGY